MIFFSRAHRKKTTNTSTILKQLKYKYFKYLYMKKIVVLVSNNTRFIYGNTRDRYSKRYPKLLCSSRLRDRD